MLEQLKKLYEIQQIDSEITELENQQSALLEKLQELETKSEELNDQVNSIGIDVERTARDAKDLEATVEADKMKIKKWENRLNDIRNQREYQALSRETENARRVTKDNEAKARWAGLDALTPKDRIVELRGKHHVARLAGSTAHNREALAASFLPNLVVALQK